jgi:hypothetical protein
MLAEFVAGEIQIRTGAIKSTDGLRRSADIPFFTDEPSRADY